jgi:hypothetical protein
MPHHLHAALVVLAIVPRCSREDATVGVLALKVSGVDVEVEHAHPVEHAYGEVAL